MVRPSGGEARYLPNEPRSVTCSNFVTSTVNTLVVQTLCYTNIIWLNRDSNKVNNSISAESVE